MFRSLMFSLSRFDVRSVLWNVVALRPACGCKRPTAAFVLLLATFASGAERPNVVLIMADDIGIEGFGCYGGSSYQTPHIDRLAAEGMRFTHAYSQPLCTPTRVQIMTGRYNHRNWRCFGVLDANERTFGHLMRDAQYRTCIAGKWQLHSYDPPDFPNAGQRRGIGMQVDHAGFDEHCVFHAWHTEDKGSRYANPTYFENGRHKQATGQYGPDVSVDFIIDFMARHRREAMFVYYPMALPHWPMNPTPDSSVWSDPARRLETSDKYFPDMVRYMDKAVGRLVDRIEELGLRRQTLILFYSDNGTDARITSRFGGKEVSGGKATPLQTGIRVPLIANWPGTITAGQITTDLVDPSDFLPTLAELSGAEIPRKGTCDGISFAPTLFGHAGPRREWCFFWYDPRPGWDKERFSRHIFALDHQYKLFSDGRLFDIEGTGFREVALNTNQLQPDAAQARAKLRKAIELTMQEPLADAAKVLLDAFGNPLE